MASQPILLDFMMQFQNIMSHRQKEPFCGYHLNPSEREPAKIQVFLGIREYAPCLNGTVYAQENAFLCGYLFLHLIPLGCKIL